jgi:hypothetical protein
MKNVAIVAAMAILAAAAAGRIVYGARAQATGCLHGADETDVERFRRTEAVRFVRSVHNAQARYERANGRYGRLGELAGLADLPTGFSAQHSADKASYLLAVKDVGDPCYFAIFSDHAGLIYVGDPLR